MLRLIPMAIVFLTSVAVAQEGIEITLRNEGSDTVTAVNSFPISEDGTVVDDNVGGHIDDVAPGQTATLNLTSLLECEPVLFYVRLKSRADREEPDLQLELDTCNDTTIVVRD